MVEKDFAARWLGLQRDTKGEFVLTARSLITAIGGGFGLIESAVPPMSFSLTFGYSHNVFLAATIAVLLAMVVMISQIIRKRPILNAITSVLGIGIAAWLAVMGGSGGSTARDFYLKDFLVNGFWILALLISLFIKRPLFGYLGSALSVVSVDWLSVKTERRLMTRMTLFWLGPFVLRLGFELPLWLANQVYLLGFVKTGLGLPLWGLWMLLTWLMVRHRISSDPGGNLDKKDS